MIDRLLSSVSAQGCWLYPAGVARGISAYESADRGRRMESREKPKEVTELPESPDGSVPAALISRLSAKPFIYSVGVKAMSAPRD